MTPIGFHHRRPVSLFPPKGGETGNLRRVPGNWKHNSKETSEEDLSVCKGLRMQRAQLARKPRGNQAVSYPFFGAQPVGSFLGTSQRVAQQLRFCPETGGSDG